MRFIFGFTFCSRKQLLRIWNRHNLDWRAVLACCMTLPTLPCWAMFRLCNLFTGKLPDGFTSEALLNTTMSGIAFFTGWYIFFMASLESYIIVEECHHTETYSNNDDVFWIPLILYQTHNYVHETAKHIKSNSILRFSWPSTGWVMKTIEWSIAPASDLQLKSWTQSTRWDTMGHNMSFALACMSGATRRPCLGKLRQSNASWLLQFELC